jgi:hypothetical protein
MPTYQDAGLIVLHGLPVTLDEDPCESLSDLVTAFSALIPQAQIWCYNGRDDVRGYPLLSALAGRLGKRIAPAFQEYLSTKQQTQPQVTRWVVGGFSAGGWGLYQWLVYRRIARGVTAWQSQVDCVFTIAAPYRNDHPIVHLGGDDANAKRWALEFADPRERGPAQEAPERILKDILSGIRLYSIYSSADTTVWPDSAELPPGLIALSNVDQQKLEHGPPQHDIHQRLIRDRSVVNYVVDSIDSCLAAQMRSEQRR